MYDALHCPNAAAGYDLSFFLLTVELLLELAPDPGSLPFFGGTRRDGAMSAGRSFHSVSGRWFWNDLPDATLAGGLTGGWFAMGGRLSTAAVVLDMSGRDSGGAEEGREPRTEALTGLDTSQAESGRSLM